MTRCGRAVAPHYERTDPAYLRHLPPQGYELVALDRLAATSEPLCDLTVSAGLCLQLEARGWALIKRLSWSNRLSGREVELTIDGRAVLKTRKLPEPRRRRTRRGSRGR